MRPSQPAMPHGSSVMMMSPSSGEVPSGAVYLSDSDVLKMQWNIVDRWKPSSEMWSFKHGYGLLGGLAVVSGTLFNNHFRTKLKLMGHGRILSYVLSTVVPAGLAVLAHNALVSEPMMVRRLTCATCGQVRAVAVQSAMGCVQPFVLSLLVCSALAKTGMTHAMPRPLEDPRGLVRFFGRMSQLLGVTFSLLLAVNVMSAIFITNAQMKASIKINQKLSEGMQQIDR